MNELFREKQKKNIINTRVIYDFTMSVIFLGVGTLMFLAPYLKIERLDADHIDSFRRYFFGSIAIAYGVFRLYRAFKKDY